MVAVVKASCFLNGRTRRYLCPPHASQTEEASVQKPAWQVLVWPRHAHMLVRAVFAKPTAYQYREKAVLVRKTSAKAVM